MYNYFNVLTKEEMHTQTYYNHYFKSIMKKEKNFSNFKKLSSSDFSYTNAEEYVRRVIEGKGTTHISSSASKASISTGTRSMICRSSCSKMRNKRESLLLELVDNPSEYLQKHESKEIVISRITRKDNKDTTLTRELKVLTFTDHESFRIELDDTQTIEKLSGAISCCAILICPCWRPK